MSKRKLVRKSQLIGLLLCFLFGPLGNLYSNVVAAVFLFIVTFILFMFLSVFAILIIWPIAIILSIHHVDKYNKKVELEETRHLEKLNVAGGMDIEKARRNAYWQSSRYPIDKVYYFLLRKIFPGRYK